MKLKTIALCIAFSLIFSFIMVGYASLSDTMTTRGNAEVKTPKGLFITNITPNTNRPSGLDVFTASFAEYSTTVTVNLSKSADRTGGGITYTIRVYNNTEYEYAYRDLYYQSTVHNNSYIVENPNSNPSKNINIVTKFPNGTVVAPDEYLDFEVTYYLGSDRTTFKAKDTFTTLVNYRFGINVETEAAARDAIAEKFLNILNTPSTYLTLVQAIDDKFDGYQEWTSNYIGNVGDATSDDAMVVNTLFAGQLQMIINGQVTPATVLIKHENLDNNPKTGDDYKAENTSNGGVFYGYGCEMTLYLTTDPLTTANGLAEVYVCVFTCNRDDEGNIVGDWYRIGDSYRGVANIVGYNGEYGGTGSFVTDNWISRAETYTVTRGYTYSIGDEVNLKTITQIYDAQAINAFRQLLYDSKAMIEDVTYAGIGITDVEDAYDNARAYFTIDANGNPVVKTDTLRVWLCPVMKELDQALKKAEDEIDNIINGKP